MAFGKAFNVFPVGPEQEHSHTASKRNHTDGAGYQSKERQGHCKSKRSHGYKSGKGDHCQQEDDRVNCCNRSHRQKYADCSGNGFAAFHVHENGENMPDYGCSSYQRDENPVVAILVGHEYGHKALGNVQNKCCYAVLESTEAGTTLVAPVLLLPSVRMSQLQQILPIKSPKGIDPRK